MFDLVGGNNMVVVGSVAIIFIVAKRRSLKFNSRKQEDKRILFT